MVIENLIIFIGVGLFTGALFWYWTKKQALIEFRAWALFTTLIFFVLAFQSFDGLFSRNAVRFMMVLFFINTVVILWRLYKITEKYVPKEYRNNARVRTQAMIEGLKHGGNHVNEARKKIQRLIRK